MYNYNNQITAYHDDEIFINKTIQDKLRKHRKANQDRLKNNIPDSISVKDESFVSQGSYANRTMIQEAANKYDIDDGVIFKKEELVGKNGGEMSALETRKMVEESLKDDKFATAPERKTNCIRVFYKEGHHVDVPSYRQYEDAYGNEILELAGADWKKSDPKKIKSWFKDLATTYDNVRDGRRMQLRRIVRLLKRFSKSRPSWNMPSGIVLTMLTAPKLPDYERDDECLYYLLKEIDSNLSISLRVYNEADTSYPQEELTKSHEDADMQTLQSKITEALGKLEVLFEDDCTREKARKAWDWVFKTGGYFESYDEENPDPDSNDSVKSSSFTNTAPPVDIHGGGKFA